jgi:hypothetical protein
VSHQSPAIRSARNVRVAPLKSKWITQNHFRAMTRINRHNGGALPPIGGLFMTTKPDCSRCSTRRLAIGSMFVKHTQYFQ